MIDIYGPRKLVKAAYIYAEALGIIDKDCAIFIEKEKLDGDGKCTSFLEDGEIHISVNKKLNKRGSECIYEILAHEMVHAKQHLLDNLDDVGEFVSFKDKVYLVRDGEDLDYYDAPWEIEAFGRQKGLYYRWLKR